MSSSPGSPNAAGTPGALQPDPSNIGGVQQPPFVRLPDPASLFDMRARRFTALAEANAFGASTLKPYLLFLSNLGQVQHAIVASLPEPVLPTPDAIEWARSFEMPPIDRGSFVADAVAEMTLERFIAGAGNIDMPESAAALETLRQADTATRHDLMRNVLADAIPVEALSGHIFVALALQVHFARLAAGLDAKRLVPVGDGACPCCGGPPVSSLIVGWPTAHGARYCACSLCATLWNYVRIRCTQCGSTKGIAYQEIDGGSGTVKAETCDNCHAYVKVLYQDKEPSLEPVADDVASLGLDILMQEGPYRRGAVNLFLLGY
ncbi:formate dehydrogenase accessory protein FdhE [Dongia soli]|uniref:Protein FdhE homolog n=1 Tax=Dongia soli TaxID=600628 RepID=A0ABU5ECR5_9PROT|nr:formate dehydrogenase accessory protein FdhE [Dongia soli]MDY0883671.1 formate dehydrogenase accessory protein FdhE [Dongia soli]